MNAFADEATDLSPREVADLLERGAAQLVDVREPHEWEAGRIAGAQHIELERLPSRADEIDRARPVVFQCRLGVRSSMATAAFRASGWDAYNLAGGIQAWVDAGLPIEPADGRVADH